MYFYFHARERKIKTRNMFCKYCHQQQHETCTTHFFRCTALPQYKIYSLLFLSYLSDFQACTPSSSLYCTNWFSLNASSQFRSHYPCCWWKQVKRNVFLWILSSALNKYNECTHILIYFPLFVNKMYFILLYSVQWVYFLYFY